MRADGGGAGEAQSELAGARRGFRVEIPADLEVVDTKPMGTRTTSVTPPPGAGQVIADIRLEQGCDGDPLRL